MHPFPIQDLVSEIFLDLKGQYGGVGVNTGPEAQVAGTPIPVPPRAKYMVLGQSSDLLVSHFSHLCNGENTTISWRYGGNSMSFIYTNLHWHLVPCR